MSDQVRGKGADSFWLEGWNPPEHPSTITDFEVGTDKIKIGRLGATFDELIIQGNEADYPSATS